MTTTSPFSPMLARLLNLKRPLAFLDIETTGFSRDRCRVVEIALIRIDPDGSDRGVTFLIDPCSEIHWAASQAHGLYERDLVGKPLFSEVLPNISDLLKGSDLAGHNIKVFDVPILTNEFQRCDVSLPQLCGNPRILDTLILLRRDQVVMPKGISRRLSSALGFFCGPRVLKEFTGSAHQALSDVRASMRIAAAYLVEHRHRVTELYEGLHVSKKADNKLDPSGVFIVKNGQPTINIGKYKGTTLEELTRTQRQYLFWMLNQDFSKKALDLIRAALREPVCPF